MPLMDPNEIFAWVRATGNADLLRQLQQLVNARVTELQTAQLGGQGAQLMQPHVQPTDEYRPGALMGQPLVGPDPQRLGVTTEEQAQINQSTFEGQKQGSGQGQGSTPVAVSTGPVSEQQRQQAQQVAQQQREQAQKQQEAVRQAQQQNAEGGGGQQAQGGGQEAQKQQEQAKQQAQQGQTGQALQTHMQADEQRLGKLEQQVAKGGQQSGQQGGQKAAQGPGGQVKTAQPAKPGGK
jgi:hypothetical protein